jgi:Rv0078B-related antitoxin
MATKSSSPASAFQESLDLFATGLALMRQNLRRRHANADEVTIDQLLNDWLLERPGAKLGDCSEEITDLISKFS